MDMHELGLGYSRTGRARWKQIVAVQEKRQTPPPSPLLARPECVDSAVKQAKVITSHPGVSDPS